jgi:hypothetical protein
VLPEWTKTFKAILAAQKADFARPQPPKTGPVTDRELLNGVASAPLDQSMKLIGADECSVRPGPNETPMYACVFFLVNKSAKEAQGELVRLVRLIEKATGGVATPIGNPFVKPTMEMRHIFVSQFPDFPRITVDVEELWLPYPDRADAPLGSRSHLAIRTMRASEQAPVTAATPPTSSAPDVAAAVSRIEGSAHMTLAPIQPGSGSGPITIENGTPFALTVYLSGPSSQKQLIAAHASLPLTLSPGVYKLAGEVSDKSVLPFFAVRTYSGGETEHFYLSTR